MFGIMGLNHLIKNANNSNSNSLDMDDSPLSRPKCVSKFGNEPIKTRQSGFIK